MSASFNPYQAWLGLPESVTQPDYFELLGLDESVEDAKVVAAAADRAASKVRRCRPGEHSAEWAALLDEIAAAKRCLSDPHQRAEYLRSGRKTDAAPTSPPAPRSRAASTATQDANLFPPTAASSSGTASKAPVATDAPLKRSRSEPSEGARRGSEPRPSQQEPLDPQAPFALPPSANPMNPMSPLGGQLDLPMSPAGVPYLQPAAPASMADPMRPADLAMSPYMPPTAAAGGVPYAHPMAPAPVSPMSPMAPVPMGQPMAAIPVAMPLGSNQAQLGAGLLPAAPYSQPSGVPTAQPYLPSGNPAAAMSAQPFVAGAPTPPTVNRSSAALLVARHERSNTVGPILIGTTIGGLLLAIVAGVYYWKSQSQSQQVASTGNDATEGGGASGGSVTNGNPSESTGSNASAGGNGSNFAFTPSASESPAKRRPRRRGGPDEASSTPATAEEPSSAEPAMTPANDSMPASMKPSETPATPEPPTKSPIPEPNKPEPAGVDELPKPTKEELARLGLAMKKTRECIGDHDFDKAAAFIELASEIPRLPEHQAMLDRLKLLSDCVSQYRAAIETSIANFEVGGSFKVGDVDVGVVETGPDKIIVRANGQNRNYSILELPVGLAAAIAGHTLPPDDSKTLMLKGAYVLAQPDLKDEDRKKAKEFLETASGSLEEAKQLLLLMEDSYELSSDS